MVFCLSLASCTIFDGRTMGKRVDDTKILLRVESAIHNNKKIPHTSAISVNNHGHIIQLSGFVDNHWEKEEADITARRVEGVEGVINNIIVKHHAHSLAGQKAQPKAILHNKR
jgi:osmotically-inducible protein OsmY